MQGTVVLYRVECSLPIHDDGDGAVDDRMPDGADEADDAPAAAANDCSLRVVKVHKYIHPRPPSSHYTAAASMGASYYYYCYIRLVRRLAIVIIVRCRAARVRALNKKKGDQSSCHNMRDHRRLARANQPRSLLTASDGCSHWPAMIDIENDSKAERSKQIQEQRHGTTGRIGERRLCPCRVLLLSRFGELLPSEARASAPAALSVVYEPPHYCRNGCSRFSRCRWSSCSPSWNQMALPAANLPALVTDHCPLIVTNCCSVTHSLEPGKVLWRVNYFNHRITHTHTRPVKVSKPG